jgi:uncharacterized cupredoxin-like copper-binding protein
LNKHVVARCALMTLIAFGAACGGDDEGTANPSDAVIEVAMVDIAFEPDRLSVSAGTPVTFRFTNEGRIVHEATIGTPEEQEDHASEMETDDADAHGEHGDPDQATISLDPGDSGELVYTFDEAGEYLIGCHVPGHYEAGMVVVVTVS